MKSVVSMVLVTALIALAKPASAADKPAPNFSLKTANGQVVELKQLQGKVVVINFWATWCGPCRAEIPGMVEVYNKYKSKGLEIIGVSLDRQGFSVVTPYAERSKINYPLVIGDDNLVRAYGGFNSIPTTFVVDRKGNLVLEHTGGVSKARFEEMVKPYL